LSYKRQDTAELEAFKAELEDELHVLSEAHAAAQRDQRKAQAELKELQDRFDKLSQKLEKFPTWTKVESYCGERLHDLDRSVKSTSERLSRIDKLEDTAELQKSDRLQFQLSVDDRLSGLESKVWDFASSRSVPEKREEHREIIESNLKLQARIDGLERQNSKVKGIRVKLVDTMRRLRQVEEKVKEPVSSSQPTPPLQPLPELPSQTTDRSSDDFVEELLGGRHPMPRLSLPKARTPVKRLSEVRKQEEAVDLSQRIIAMERLNTFRNSFLPPDRIPTREDGRTAPTSEELGQYLPGEAESVVLTAIIDKTNRTRHVESVRQTPPHMKQTSTLPQERPVQPQDYREGGPSRELLENLRSRGMFLK
jgi:hypothetical protein